MFRPGVARNSNRNPDMNRMMRRMARSNQAMSEAIQQLAAAQAGVVKSNGASNTQAALISRSIDQKKPSSYDGKGDPTKLENWVREFDKIFVTLQVPDDMRVDSAAYYLIEDADIWWSNNKYNLTTKVTIDEEGEEQVQLIEFGWKEFKKAIRAEFFPPHMRKRKRTEFDQLKQTDDMSVQEFYVKFQELARFVPELVPSEEEKALRFEERLNPEIQALMGAGDYTSLKEVYSRACNAERIEQRRTEAKKPKIAGKETTQEIDKGNSFNQNRGKGNFTRNKNFGNRGHNGNFRQGGSSQHHSKGNQSSSQPRSQSGSQNQSQSQNQVFERRYFCKFCIQNHPGKDCDGNLVDCNFCGKPGHRAYECFVNPNATVRGHLQNPRRPTGGVGNGANSGGRFQNGGNSRPPISAPVNAASSRNVGTANAVNANRGAGKRNAGNIHNMSQADADNHGNVVTGT